jgi:tetratricopeptide (TPR) repeat protein
MIRFAKALLCILPLGGVCFAQTQTPAAAANASDDKTGAYYNFAMGRLYAGMAAAEGNKTDYVAKAIQHYKEALRLDPSASIIFEELTDIYVQTGRLRDAVTQAEDLLKQNPDNLDARRMLGRIYFRMLSDTQAQRVPEEYLKKATAEYETITTKDPKDADSWVMLGRLYSVANRSQDAEKAYDAALKADPGNEDALTGLAQMYAQLGDNQKAIEKLKGVAEKSPNERLLAFLAEQYEQLKDYKNAAEVLKKAYELAPDNSRIAAALARDLMYSGDLDGALKLYQQLATDEPRSREYALSLVQVYLAKRDYGKAREALEKAKTISPRDMEIRYQEVKLLEAEGKSDQAITTLKAMVDETGSRDGRIRAMLLEEYGILLRNAEKYPLAIEAFQQMAAIGGDSASRGTLQVIDTYRQSRDFAAAMREVDAALKKFPDERMFKMERATVLGDQGKADEAAAELRGLLKGDNDRDVYLALAQIFERSKRFADMGKALDEVEKLSKTDEDRAAAYFMRGAMYERMKRFDAAEAEFRKVLAVDAENSGALNYLGYMLADRNVRLDEAQQMIKKALDLDPDNGAYLDSLGWVYFRQGKLEEAENLLLRALEQMGQDPAVRDHLGDVYAKQGKTREALAQWQASLAEYRKQPPNQTDPEEVAKVTKKVDDARGRLAQETKKK